MDTAQQNPIETTLTKLINDAGRDHGRMLKSIAKRIFRPIGPADFKDVYLAISPQQGKDIHYLITEHKLKNIVEFGTSFGISTLYLAKAAAETGGKVVTTELVASKAARAVSNFKSAEVDHLIEVRVGDAMETLKGFSPEIDFLLLDGWKDLYLPLFKMLEPNFHSNTIVYVDNADMGETKAFLQVVGNDKKFTISPREGGKAALITLAV